MKLVRDLNKIQRTHAFIITKKNCHEKNDETQTANGPINLNNYFYIISDFL